ncbi:hypothetical protein [Phenylobacterium sp.]|jgi:uncharacterized protein YcfJ|uniref:hypothetical protein n=1 Tax=Phenylobacterium sp. TaxID=1871053 RepID=UPI003783EFA0
MTRKFTKTAMILTVAGAVALPAGQAAAGTSKTESALIGALLGGLGGAAVGNGRGEAVAIGAVAGAALGVAVDKGNDRRKYRNGYRYRSAQPYYRDSRYRSYDRGYYGRGYERSGYYNSRW